MKKIVLILLCFMVLVPFDVFAGYVRGHYRNGTYVNGHYRSEPDGNPYNNYSFPGNTNPYTGKTAGGSPETYLRNYYKDSNYSNTNYYSSSLYTPTIAPIIPTTYTPSSYYSSYSEAKQIPGGTMQYGIATCDRGYKKDYSTQSCSQINIPFHATLNQVGDGFVCDRGYKKNDNTQSCDPVYVPAHATLNQIGDGFECDEGYRLYLNNQCESIAPANAHVDRLQHQGWVCDSGYRQDGNVCVNASDYCARKFGNAYAENDQCYCSKGYTYDKLVERCVKEPSKDEQCAAQYGSNTYAVGQSDGTVNCRCKAGYRWDASGTQCVFDGSVHDIKTVEATQGVNGVSGVMFLRDLYVGVRGSDVGALQDILIQKGFLTKGSNSGYFGAATRRALIKYQRSVGLTGTGYFGSATRDKIGK